MIHFHTADDCLRISIQSMFLVDSIHDRIAQVVGNNHDYDFLLRLQGNARCLSMEPGVKLLLRF